MPHWESLTVTITSRENETVKSVTCGEQTILTDVKWSEVRVYIHELNSEGWQVIDSRSTAGGEVYEFRRLIES